MVSAAVMGGVAMGGTLLGGLLQGAGAKESADAQASAYNYKAGVALINKQVAQQNASWAISAAGTKAEEVGMTNRQKIGQEKVVQAASGFEVNSGSNAKVRQDMSTASQFDQNVIKWEGDKAAYGYEIQATTDQAEANLDRMAADQSREAGDIGELTSFVNAGTSAASKWFQGKNTGVF